MKRELIRKALIVACGSMLLLACLACVGMAVLVHTSEDEESEEIWRVALASKDGQLRLADAVPGEWDHVVVFGAYMPRRAVCRTLDVAMSECEQVVPFESADDGAMSLAFVADRQVVRYVRHSRKHGDFSPVATGQPVPRAQAVYRIVPGSASYNGRRALDFVPLG